MSFNDIFKSSFLESITEFSLLDTLIGLVFALVVGLFIFLIYQKTLTGVMYSSGLALTLVGMTMVTTLVIMAVTSNVVLSLGMVGALSIVRFRAAIKEPVEIVTSFPVGERPAAQTIRFLLRASCSAGSVGSRTVGRSL